MFIQLHIHQDKIRVKPSHGLTIEMSAGFNVLRDSIEERASNNRE